MDHSVGVQRPDESLGSPVPPAPDSLSPRSMVSEHWTTVFRLMHRLCGRVHEAEDLTQEVFLRALPKLDQLRPQSNIRAWLLKIGANAFLDTRRRRREVSLEAQPAESVALSSSSGSVLERDELVAHVQGALLGLTETQRAVFLLRTTEDMSFNEISEMIGVTEATARWHMLQARQELLRRLEGKL